MALYEKDADWFAALLPIFTSDTAKTLIPNPPVHDVKSRRHNAEKMTDLLFPPVPLKVEVETVKHEFKSFDEASISIYEVRPKALDTTKPSPAVLYAHGGGMICLDAATGISQVEVQVAESGVPFFSVDYRLAPESTHPGPTEDVYHALLWLHQHSSTLNIDLARIAISGDSAGGGIAAGVALMARDRKIEPPLAKQILLYPMLDHRTVSADPELLPVMTWKPVDNITGWSALLGRDVAKESVEDIFGLQYASPARASNLDGLPDTYIDTGALDLFHKEILNYAERLKKENGSKKVDLHVFPGLPHAFNGIARGTPSVKKALDLRNAAYASLKA